ncbi:MAG: hypothetical protein ACRD6W_11515, partial [Nitrososphaerales archaeon]
SSAQPAERREPLGAPVARKTVIRHPDGSTTEIRSSTSLGRGCSAFGWFFLALFVVFAPAAWWGWWSIPAYVLMAALLIAGLTAKAKKNKEREAGQ